MYRRSDVHCNAVRKRLVAWRDAELSRGQHTRIGEHLRMCSECSQTERELQAATPIVPTHLPPVLQAKLDAATAVDVVLAAAGNPTHNRWPDPPAWRRWLIIDVEVPRWAALAAAALLATTLGWAWQTSSSLDLARAELASRATSPIQLPVAGDNGMSGDQFSPASWQPPDDGGYR
jgi:predicted anti-sigma-YlaC factor YlaD